MATGTSYLSNRLLLTFMVTLSFNIVCIVPRHCRWFDCTNSYRYVLTISDLLLRLSRLILSVESTPVIGSPSESLSLNVSFSRRVLGFTSLITWSCSILTSHVIYTLCSRLIILLLQEITSKKMIQYSLDSRSTPGSTANSTSATNPQIVRLRTMGKLKFQAPECARSKL